MTDQDRLEAVYKAWNETRAQGRESNLIVAARRFISMYDALRAYDQAHFCEHGFLVWECSFCSRKAATEIGHHDPAFTREDYAFLAGLLRERANDKDIHALLSNNYNLILAALDHCATSHHLKSRT